MLKLKPLSEIAGVEIDWLKARHHFAIGPYGNPDHKAVGNLYVFNDDEIASQSGLPLHPHADVDIVTYLREGAITHTDMRLGQFFGMSAEFWVNAQVHYDLQMAEVKLTLTVEREVTPLETYAHT